jgi:fatty acid desaturase
MLKYRADYRSLAFQAAYFIVFFVCWFVIPMRWKWVLPSLILLCTLNFMVAVVIHNTIHCPKFKSKILNRVDCILLTLAFGSPATGYVPGHNLSHHKHLQTAKDNARTSKLRFRWNFLNQFLFFFVMIPGIIRTENRFVKEIGAQRPRWSRVYFTELAILWIWRFFWLYLDWKKFLLFSLLPNIYAVWGIFGTNYWQHDGCDERHPYNHSRTFRGKLFNFLVCNNGYHGAHHMRPAMHWSLYPEFHRSEIEPYLHPNLNLNTLTAYCIKAYIWPGKRLDYLGNPVVLPPKLKDEDWVMEAKNNQQLLHASNMGFEVN